MPAADPPESGVETADERSTLLDYLRQYRLTLEAKCADLDAAQLARRSVPPSTLSLLGLVRHLTDVERYWFRRVIAGADVLWRFRTADDQDAAFNGAVADSAVVDEAWDAWRCEVAFAEQVVAGISDLASSRTTRTGEPVQVRDVLVHMIEEYARHCGHAVRRLWPVRAGRRPSPWRGPVRRERAHRRSAGRVGPGRSPA
jgi:uncharacterized damage-inducible protein DinB